MQKKKISSNKNNNDNSNNNDLKDRQNDRLEKKETLIRARDFYTREVYTRLKNTSTTQKTV